jgi:dihydropteroate synthase
MPTPICFLSIQPTEHPVILADTRSQIRHLMCALRGRPSGVDQRGDPVATPPAQVFHGEFTVKTRRGDLVFGGRTLVMGVLNVTPDSFSDGGRFRDPEAAVDHGLELAEEGADVIDVGGESTRPGARPIPVEEECKRVIPVIERLASWLSIPISVDTMKAAVATQALAAGASVVNVVGALELDPEVADAAAREKAGLVLMHMKGRPETMTEEAAYPQGVLTEVVDRLDEAIALAERRGVDRERIIVDPGLGFGKRAGHTLEVLARLEELRCLGRPILVGPSRKSFIGAVTGLPVDERFPGTAAACVAAVLHGAHMVRVHEVAPILPVLRMAEAIRDAAGAG